MYVFQSTVLNLSRCSGSYIKYENIYLRHPFPKSLSSGKGLTITSFKVFQSKSAILAEFSLKCGGTYIWSISVPIMTLAKS